MYWIYCNVHKATIHNNNCLLQSVLKLNISPKAVIVVDSFASAVCLCNLCLTLVLFSPLKFVPVTNELRATRNSRTAMTRERVCAKTVRATSPANDSEQMTPTRKMASFVVL